MRFLLAVMLAPFAAQVEVTDQSAGFPARAMAGGVARLEKALT